MAVYTARNSARSYGHAIGVLLLDEIAPFIPGSVGNASSYSYPVLFRPVEGLTFQRVFDRDPACADLLKAAARDLEAKGVQAIASNCGFMLPFQREVADAVSVPVLLSSLLQLPLIAASLGEGAAIGIITADQEGITSDLLSIAGLDQRTPVVVRGMQDMPEFRRFLVEMQGSFDPELVREETLDLARLFVSGHDRVGAILLECSELPPYAEAVQRATGLPVFDFMTLIDFFNAAAHRRSYSGRF
jgi:hypothetical protein